MKCSRRLLWIDSSDPRPDENRLQGLLPEGFAVFPCDLSRALQLSGSGDFCGAFVNSPIAGWETRQILEALRRSGGVRFPLLVRDRNFTPSGAVRLARFGASAVLGDSPDPEEFQREVVEAVLEVSGVSETGGHVFEGATRPWTNSRESRIRMVQGQDSVSLAESHRTQSPRTESPRLEPYYGILGASRAIRRICEIIRLVANRRCTVLIQGETGTGKEVAARAIHRASSRAKLPLVAVNCGAIPEPLLESEHWRCDPRCCG